MVVESVAHALDHLGLAHSPGFAESCADYAVELCRWNEKTNLTGAKDALAFVRGPLFDALTLLPVLANDAPLVDVGSGGGLPGVPAALWQKGLRVALVEPRPLRISFLTHIVSALGLEADVVCSKDKALATAAFGAAVSQAVWPANEWIGRAQRLVRKGGAIYALASTPIDETALPRGCSLETRFETQRPSDGAPRFAVRARVSQ
jgi:16S rRNA (guanine527-N7)-methyltransferase